MTSDCTEVSASWCPNCGDCTCHRDEWEHGDWEDLSDEDCPLHGPDSKHGLIKSPKAQSLGRLEIHVSKDTMRLAQQVSEALPEQARAALGNEDDVHFEWESDGRWYCVEVLAIDERESDG